MTAVQIDDHSMSRRTLAVGVFLTIKLADGSLAYGRALEPPYVAFYNLRSREPIGDETLGENRESAVGWRSSRAFLSLFTEHQRLPAVRHF
jgi:hypothetical protein